MHPSVLILTKNNEGLIENCLKSVYGWASGIVVVDSGSVDRTLKICQQYKCNIFHKKWEGFSCQREFAAKKANNDWVFYLDSDERLTKGLKEEIDQLDQNSKIAAFTVKRENIILGKFLKHGGWYPDEQIRLINKHQMVKWIGHLHEYPKIKGEIKNLKGAVIHLTHRGINWCLEKSIDYTDEVAKLFIEAHHPKIKWWHLITGPLREFWQRGIIKKGLFEGLEGFIAVLYAVFDSFITYAKIWELQKGKSMTQSYREIDRRFVQEGKY